MSTYYKARFSKINKVWQRRKQNKRKKAPLSVLVEEFLEIEFSGVVKALPETDQ